MTYKFDGYNWLVRLERGELLVQSLTQLAKEQKIAGAWLTGLGGAAWAEIGFYDLTSKEHKWRKLDQGLEITSLEGNIAWEGEEPVLHIHGTFSDENMQALGGHVKELEVSGTCEILLHRWYGEGLKRSQDDDTGLKLLDL